ncbi:MAG: tRNA (adenosine(37)-N6)-threonylcarbamoyltransferase complex ATPase subunit type 1 TsaE [Burkholderiaceae bacterium]
MQTSSTGHHLSILEKHRERWPSEAACAACAASIAARIVARPALRDAFIELHGPLGAGKTTFVRYLLHALGVQGRVKSPTYAVMEAYDLPSADEPFEIRHFDFYRFDDPQEWEDAGFREVFASPALKLAEWPEKATGFLPLADLRIEIEPDAAEARTVVLRAATARGVALLGGAA